MLDVCVYIVNVYRSPSYSPDDNDALMVFLDVFCTGKEGDFILPGIPLNGVDMSSPSMSHIEKDFYDLFTLMGLSQIVDCGTYFPSGNTLDLLLTSFPERCGFCKTLPPLPSCAHTPVLVSYVFQGIQAQPSSNGNINDRLWTRGKYDIIARILRGVD